jgi:hypothetical protein
MSAPDPVPHQTFEVTLLCGGITGDFTAVIRAPSSHKAICEARKDAQRAGFPVKGVQARVRILAGRRGA